MGFSAIITWFVAPFTFVTTPFTTRRVADGTGKKCRRMNAGMTTGALVRT